MATVDATATRVGLDVLRRGGNAVDAAVAAAATLGVTEPFSAGIGGGGFFVFYDARTGKVSTIDGREAAPAAMAETTFVDPATGLPYAFQEARVSGLSVGVPGTLATWQEALRRWGTRSCCAGLRPAATWPGGASRWTRPSRPRVNDNAAAFGQFSSTSALYLPGGQPPAVGSTFRNPDLARTYELIARQGTDAFYRGQIARDIVATVQHPPLADHPDRHLAVPDPAGRTDAGRPRRLRGRRCGHRPTSRYRGYDVYGMATPSSGGSTVGEALNILERSRPAGLDRTQATAPLPRGQRARLRRPQPLRRRRHAAVHCSTSCSPTASPPSAPARSTRPTR